MLIRKKKTSLIAVRLEPDLMAAVEEEANKEERPLGMMARILIREGLVTRRKRRSKTDPQIPLGFMPEE
jgi:hypothetical protein